MDGWGKLFEDWSWARGEGRFPIAAYSEFMPPPRIGQKPYGPWEIEQPFSRSDPWGWQLNAREQENEIAPGFEQIGRQLLAHVVALAAGGGAHRIGHRHLEENPYWPPELAARASSLEDERHLFLSPLALSKTQDDKGRVRWTLFGGSHLGPARGFWRSFYSAPSLERPEADCVAAIGQLLGRVFGEPCATPNDLRAAGFYILPTGSLGAFPEYADGVLPKWTAPYRLRDDASVDGVRYLLTFRPFAWLPPQVREAYFDERLHLLPSPGSLVFWGSPLYRRLTLPCSEQILLLQSVARHSDPHGIRVPQSGWLHHPAHSHDKGLGEANNTFRRTHRWQRIHRDETVTDISREEHLYKVLFGTHPDDIALYGKPMARNAQLWSSEFRPILDGPSADADAIRRAVGEMRQDRSYGYRFFYPPMHASDFSIFWHCPVVVFRDAASGEAKTVPNLLTGFFTAEKSMGMADPAIELWPRPAAAESEPASRARPSPAERPGRAAAAFAAHLGVPADKSFAARDARTFPATATRGFEVRYWRTIASLAEGRYLNKNAADCSDDAVTRARIPWPGRDLDALGDHLQNHYRRLAGALCPAALVGAFPFRWRTDFEFPWMEGWFNSQTGKSRERNIGVIIPGRNRSEAVVMADHYDTAYMEDVYGYRSGRNDGPRMAASGADDNHSATAALMLAANVFMTLSREGNLERDIWLVHLTGEEFPSDCLGARDLAQKLVEGTCKLESLAGPSVDLSGVAIRGLYVLDMIAHNNERQRDVFQIAPGADHGSLWLAYQAHAAAEMWADGAKLWNAGGLRRGLGRGRRSPHGGAIPRMAAHLAPRGEVRFQDDPRSTLFNTDGQIFADAGIPTVLFMENYDINREGYHDSLDTMANIDLDFGAAVAAIAIEAVARAAIEPLPQVCARNDCGR